MGDAIIDIRRVFHTFKSRSRSVRVLRGLELEARAGELVAICGKSGSGKTTLLNVIAGLLQPNSGKIMVAGRDVYAMKDSACSRFRNETIGFIYQQFSLISHMSCEENIKLPGLFSTWKASRIDDRVDKLLAMMDITELRSSYPDTLSGGQQQRIAIARALLLKPSILLCDEPIGDLDSETGTKVLNIFKGLNRDDGITIVVVTHEGKVSAMADRALYLENGRLRDEKAS